MNNVSRLRNAKTISAVVAEILSQLPKGHTRPEAYSKINAANILDKNGERIQPSVWYHSLVYTPKRSGKTLMNELYPEFVPTASPYPRLKKPIKNVETKAIPTISRERLEVISRTLLALSNEIMGTSDNAIHASIHESERDIGASPPVVKERRKRA